MREEIKYQAIWGKLYILLGVLFGLLFIFGGLLLNDYTILFNVIASFIIIYLGNSMLKRPYAHFSSTEIVVYGFLGAVRKHYVFDDINQIEVRGEHLYQQGKKLKINGWMIDKRDWKRLLDYFNKEEAFLDELVD